MVELWRAGTHLTGADPEKARAAEALGWDGQMFMDSQSLAADPWTQMGAWAVATERIKLCTGDTNPFTRNLAVTAACAATVQQISGGRAVLGIGRGDSALAYLGYAPVKLAAFEKALVSLQALLSGEEIDFADSGETVGGAASHEGLSLGARPEGVKLKWLPADQPKVPMDVAATGPKVIAMGARIAERVTFSVGAEVERLQWGLDVASDALTEAGMADKPVSYGAQLVVVCHSDAQVALETAMVMAPPLARFQVIGGKAVGPEQLSNDNSLEAVRTGYDMTKHGVAHDADKIKGGGLSPEFVKRFAIVGTPDQCTERLLELRKLGLERFVAVGPGVYPPEWSDEDAGLFERECIPALRAASQ